MESVTRRIVQQCESLGQGGLATRVVVGVAAKSVGARVPDAVLLVEVYNRRSCASLLY
jgi:hypothetical protein